MISQRSRTRQPSPRSRASPSAFTSKSATTTTASTTQTHPSMARTPFRRCGRSSRSMSWMASCVPLSHHHLLCLLCLHVNTPAATVFKPLSGSSMALWCLAQAREIFRVLRPGARFSCSEYLLTPHFNWEDERHVAMHRLFLPTLAATQVSRTVACGHHVSRNLARALASPCSLPLRLIEARTRGRATTRRTSPQRSSVQAFASSSRRRASHLRGRLRIRRRISSCGCGRRSRGWSGLARWR